MRPTPAKGSEWRNDAHRLDVKVVEATPSSVKIKPMTRHGPRPKLRVLTIDDFHRYYRPKSA
jgi:hypothetical protein